MISFVRVLDTTHTHSSFVHHIFLNIVIIFLWTQFSQFQNLYIISHSFFVIFTYLISFIRFLVITHIHHFSFIRLSFNIVYIFLWTRFSHFQAFYIFSHFLFIILFCWYLSSDSLPSLISIWFISSEYFSR